MKSSKDFLFPLVLSAVFAVLYCANYSDQPTAMDEYTTIFIVNGMAPPNDFLVQPDTAGKYLDIKASEIRDGNTTSNVIHSTLAYEGGNALAYYIPAHAMVRLFGPHFGVLHTLRLFSCTISLAFTILFFLFVKKLAGNEVAFVTTLLAIVMGIHDGIFIRTYALSNLAVLCYLIIYYRILLHASVQRPGIERLHWLLLFLTCLLPFLHFFNILFVGVGLLVAVSSALFKISSSRTLLKISISQLSGILVFCGFYFLFNQQGHGHLNAIDLYWKNFAQLFGTAANTIVPPATLVHLAEENALWLLALVGLDFRVAFSAIRISHELPVLVLFLFYCVKLLWNRLKEGWTKFPALALCMLSIITIHLLVFNLMSINSGHTVMLFVVHYRTALIICWLLCCVSLFASQRSGRWIFIVYAGLVFFNFIVTEASEIQGKNPNIVDAYKPEMEYKLQMIEAQFAE